MKDLIFHEDRARAFIEHIHSAYMGRRSLYQHVHHLDGHAPQRMFVPDGVAIGSLEHRIILFFATLMDYMSGSYDIFATAEYLWNNSRILFTDDVLYMEEVEIETHLRRARSTMPQSKAYRWLGSSASLYHHLNGDPVHIFSLGASIDEIDAVRRSLSRKKGTPFLPGYGPKLVSLLSLHFFDFGILKELPLGAFPVDRHIQRQIIGMGIIECSLKEYDAARAIAEFIRPRLVTLCDEMGVPVFELAHAMWFLGNRLCFSCRSSILSGKTEKLAYCPIRDHCAGGMETQTYQTKGKWIFGESATEDTDMPSPQLDLF